MNIEHTFVICAYRNSPFLEECIKSLLAQHYLSQILLVTSTPSANLKDICDRYNIKYLVRKGTPGIADDWNFAYNSVKTEYMTIVHQDYIYFPDYAIRMLESMQLDKKSLIGFCNYSELKGNRLTENSINLRIKRFLLRPIRERNKASMCKYKRRALRFGNAICCPSVIYHKSRIDELLTFSGKESLFQVHLRSDLDWEAWEWLSKEVGSFVYVQDNLMAHRIHEKSETTVTIRGGIRQTEDQEMFKKFWPTPVARLLTVLYSKSEKGNAIE